MLKQLRVRAGWTQARLAQAAGVSQSCIARLESGLRRRPGFATLHALADALSLDQDERAKLILSFALPARTELTEPMLQHGGAAGAAA